MISFRQFVCFLSWMFFSVSLFPVQPLLADSQNSIFSLPSEASVSLPETGTSPFLLPAEENDSSLQALTTLTAVELQQQGTRLAQEGKLEKAKRFLTLSLEKDPTNLVSLNNLGLVMRKRGRLDDALQAYDQALAVDEHYALTYKNLGILLEKLGQSALAVKAYRKYCALDANATDIAKVTARADWLATQPDRPPPEDTQQHETEEQKKIQQYMAENALVWHDRGAHLFAESVAEKDREKLSSAIDYLEKAAVGLPDNKGITVDLADAYMEAGSAGLVAWAIELYESVFESFSEDPLLARLVDAYYQVGNFDMAFALAGKRMAACPVEMRRAAAVQMSFIAFSSQKEKLAIAAINEDMQNRGEDPVLQLIIATLQEAQGETDTALLVTLMILDDKTVESDLRAYVEKVKNRILEGAR